MSSESRSSSIIIRSFNPSDLLACQKIFTEGHQSYENPMVYINLILQTDMSDIEKNYLQVLDGNWWVAVSTDDNRVIGQVAGLPLSKGDSSYYNQLPDDKRDKVYELLRMGIATDIQREGIGSRLLSTLIEFARKKGYHEVHLTTLTCMDRACAFYEKNGFVKGQIDKTPFDGVNVENVEEAKELFKNLPKPTIFQVNDIIPEEDQRLMKMPIIHSKHTYVQHYSLML